jgi:hypothetical protein
MYVVVHELLGRMHPQDDDLSCQWSHVWPFLHEQERYGATLLYKVRGFL